MNADQYFYDKESLTVANTVEVLLGGEEIFPKLFELLKNARQSVCLQIYEFHDDDVGHQVAQELIAAAKRGCDVKVIYDYWGSILSRKSFFNKMENAGIDVKCYHSFLSKDVGKKFFKRNHRKTLVVDGSHAMLGGFNIGDAYVKSWQDQGIHDFSLIMHGEVCKQVYHYFDQVWKTKTFTSKFKHWVSKKKYKKNGLFKSKKLVKVLGNHHIYQRWRIRRDFLHAFKQAKKSIWIINPYFIPDKAIIKNLIKAVDRGVAVKIIVPERSDVRFVDYASKVVLYRLIEKGVEVYHWPGFSHGKAICVDQLWLSLGSYNFDYRSLLHNLELVAHTVDEECVKKFVTFYQNAIDQHCKQQSDAIWKNLSLIEKFFSIVFYRFRAFL
ncbi:phospholipase D-like domain-containing protein [bacterium]|nr:phospholipase D-like domain-containing protein [bacterium]